jgi:electron transfer flavoprotein alpha subunit/transcriptional regulator with XRE-family HTH domain
MTTMSDKIAKEIWIVGDLRTERLWRQSLKVMAKAIPLSGQAHAPVAMLLMGAKENSETKSRSIDLSACVSMEQAAQEAVSQGAQTVYCVEHSQLEVPRTDIYARVLADLVKAKNPWLVLTALNDFGRETAAFCAQRCKAGLIADCIELVLHEGQVVGRCPAWGGQILADITLAQGWPTAFVTVQPHGVSLKADASGDGRIEKIGLHRIDLPHGMQLLECAMEPVAAKRLEDAETVVAGGAGLGDVRGFGMVRELAAALGGEVGATRPPVLNHWVEGARLIGQTGNTVRPKLLFSVGTSGAIQYTAGIMEADTIVAINRDPAAPIFQIADIGLVGDSSTLLPLITQQAKQVAMRRLADAACYIDGPTDQPPGGFGAAVRQLREARDWSMAELADKTGQNPDFIQQVETDQMSPPVGFILRMAQAMKVDPGTFLSNKEQTAIRDRRAQAYHQRTQNYSYETLTPDAESSHLRAFMVTIEPYLAHKPVAYKHEGEEFIYVMSGELEFTLGTKVHVLKTGESIHFNSDVPHKLKSLSSEATRCLVVLYTI